MNEQEDGDGSEGRHESNHVYQDARCGTRRGRNITQRASFSLQTT